MIWVILILLSGNVLFENVFVISEHWGTKFVVSFLRSYSNRNTVVITTREITNVTINFHETGFTTHVTILANQSYRHDFGDITTAKPYMEVLKKKAVSIESTHDVLVYSFSPRDKDGYHTLPVSSLGNEYIAVTMENDDYEESGKPQIVIVATEKDTSVEIIFKSTKKNKCYVNDEWSNSIYVDGYSLTLNMDAYDVINVYCFRDMTGTRVTSNGPIGVISGCKCVSIPKGSKCKHIVEMLPPRSAFAHHFTIPHNIQSLYSITMRVLAPNDGTTFRIGNELVTLSANEFRDFDLGGYSDVVCVNASELLQVTLLIDAKGNSGLAGEIFMTVLPSTLDLLNDYFGFTGGENTYERFVSVSQAGNVGATSATECRDTYYCGVRYIQATIPAVTTSKTNMAVFHCSLTGGKYGFPIGVKTIAISNSQVTPPEPALSDSTRGSTTTPIVETTWDLDDTTTSSETTTSSSEAATSSSEATTSPSEATTSNEAPTSPREATTSSSEATTSSSEATTSSSKATTSTPGTSASSQETISPPTETTDSPSETTDSPSEATESPSEVTESHSETTEAPSATTEAPSEATESPNGTTGSPSGTTESPNETTESYGETTTTSSETSQSSNENAATPTETTTSNDVTTSSSINETHTPGNNETTLDSSGMNAEMSTLSTASPTENNIQGNEPVVSAPPENTTEPPISSIGVTSSDLTTLDQDTSSRSTPNNIFNDGVTGLNHLQTGSTSPNTPHAGSTVTSNVTMDDVTALTSPNTLQTGSTSPNIMQTSSPSTSNVTIDEATSLTSSNPLQSGSTSTSNVTMGELTTSPDQGSSPSTSNFTMDEVTALTLPNPLQTGSPSTSNVTLDDIASRYSTTLQGTSTSSAQPRTDAMLLCACPCRGNHVQLNQSITQTLIDLSIDELILEKTNLSRSRRTKISVKNVYQSENNVGVTSVLFLSLFLALMVAYDIPIIVKDVLYNVDLKAVYSNIPNKV